MNSQPAEDKAVIVTGAAQGIGKAIAQRFAVEGGRVALFDINAAAAERTAAEIGGATIGVAGDVANEQDVERVFADVDSADSRPCARRDHSQ
jgi:NAD(P)-dependent dehydrogenase (short-subunit alcohol dehydrogenase family)